MCEEGYTETYALTSVAGLAEVNYLMEIYETVDYIYRSKLGVDTWTAAS